MSLDKTIRAMQFIAKPAVKLTNQAVAKIAEHAVPRTKEFIDTWNYEWSRYPGQRPSIAQAKPASSIAKPSKYRKIFYPEQEPS